MTHGHLIQRGFLLAASAWLAMHPRLANRTCRFDVVAIAGEAGAASLDWRTNAFDAA